MTKIQTAQCFEDGSNRLIRETKAADYLDLSRSFIKQLRVRGGGPLFVKCGRAVRYRMEDLDKWIEENVRRNTIRLNTAGAKKVKKGGKK